MEVRQLHRSSLWLGPLTNQVGQRMMLMPMLMLVLLQVLVVLLLLLEPVAGLAPMARGQQVEPISRVLY